MSRRVLVLALLCAGCGGSSDVPSEPAGLPTVETPVAGAVERADDQAGDQAGDQARDQARDLAEAPPVEGAGTGPAVAPENAAETPRQGAETVPPPVLRFDDPRLVALLSRIADVDRPALSIEELRDDELLSSGVLPWRFEPPFLVLAYPTPGDARERRRAEREVPRTANLLRWVTQRFFHEIAAPAGRPEFAQSAVVPVFVTSEISDPDATFGKPDTGRPRPAKGVAFEAERKRLVVRVALPTREGLRAADDGIQPHLDQQIARQAVLALLFTASGERRYGGLPYALAMGLADRMGVVEVDVGEEFELPPGRIRANRIALERVSLGRRARQDITGSSVALDDLMRMDDARDVRDWAMERGLEHTRRPWTYRDAWFMHAYAMASFLWNYDDASYRSALQAYVKECWDADAAGAPSLMEALGCADEDARADFEEALQWHATALLRRRVGRKPGGSRWWLPESTPPMERMDDD